MVDSLLITLLNSFDIMTKHGRLVWLLVSSSSVFVCSGHVHDASHERDLKGALRIDTALSKYHPIIVESQGIEYVGTRAHKISFYNPEIRNFGHISVCNDVLFLAHGYDDDPVTSVSLHDGTIASIGVERDSDELQVVYFFHRSGACTFVGNGKVIRIYDGVDSLLGEFGYRNDAVAFGNNIAFTSRSDEIDVVSTFTFESNSVTIRCTKVRVSWPYTKPASVGNGMLVTYSELVTESEVDSTGLRASVNIFGHRAAKATDTYVPVCCKIVLDENLSKLIDGYSVAVIGASSDTLAFVLQSNDVRGESTDYAVIASLKLNTVKVIPFIQQKDRTTKIDEEDDRFSVEWPSGAAYAIDPDFHTLVRLWPATNANGWMIEKIMVP